MDLRRTIFTHFCHLGKKEQKGDNLDSNPDLPLIVYKITSHWARHAFLL